MFFKSPAVDELIIKVDKETAIEMRGEDGVHCPLKGGGGVAEPKGHHDVLVQPEACAEGRFLDVTGGDADLIVPHLQVQLAEHTRTADGIQQLIDSREGEVVFE